MKLPIIILTFLTGIILSISIGSFMYAGYMSKNYIMKQKAAKTRQRSYPSKPVAEKTVPANTFTQTDLPLQSSKPFSSSIPSSPSVEVPKPQKTSLEIQSIDVGTQTETADPKILFMLDGVLEQQGDKLFYYAQAIDTQKKNPSLRLKLQTYARRGYIALNTIVTDAATLEAIQQTNDLDGITKQVIKDSDTLITHVTDLMIALAEPNIAQQNSLKKTIQSAVEKLLKENVRIIEADIETQINETITAIKSLQASLEKEQSILEAELISFTK